MEEMARQIVEEIALQFENSDMGEFTELERFDRVVWEKIDERPEWKEKRSTLRATVSRIFFEMVV
jgi:hypothetical protein